MPNKILKKKRFKDQKVYLDKLEELKKIYYTKIKTLEKNFIIKELKCIRKNKSRLIISNNKLMKNK
jgi:hypothetical protein